MRAMVAVGAALLVAACGNAGDGGSTEVLAQPGASRSAPAGAARGEPYQGPMRLRQSVDDDASVTQRSGAAGRALECDGAAYDGGGGDYLGGLSTVRRTPQAALADWLATLGTLPSEGYRLERRTGHRALLSYDVAGRTRIAVIVYDAVRDYRPAVGWGVESWSQCDPAELPAEVAEALGFQVWTSASGARVPVTTVRSFQGPEHCDWQDITFLQLGPDGDDAPGHDPAGQSIRYLSDSPAEFAGLLTTTAAPVPTLPPGSTNTGYHRAGRQLWLGPTTGTAPAPAAYLVSTSDPGDIERWPRTVRHIGCA